MSLPRPRSCMFFSAASSAWRTETGGAASSANAATAKNRETSAMRCFIMIWRNKPTVPAKQAGKTLNHEGHEEHEGKDRRTQFSFFVVAALAPRPLPESSFVSFVVNPF